VKYIKFFESFDILKYVDEINNFKLIDIDPYGEEEWDEVEIGDMIYNVDKFMNINFEIYNGTQDIKTKFKKLTRISILKSLIKIRNKQVTRNKLKSENIFRKINKKKNDINNQIDIILKDGKVKNSNRNVTLSDIKNGLVNSFVMYYISKNNTPVVDKYISNIVIHESRKDIFIDDFWDEVEKYKNDISIKIEQKTFNSRYTGIESAGNIKNLYFTQLEYLVNEKEIILESTNVEDEVKIQLNKIIKIESDDMINDLNKIKKDLNNIDYFINQKLDIIEKRFPDIKKHQ